MRWLGACAMVLSAILVSVPADAQDRWTLDVRGGPSLPTRDFGEDPLNTGLGLQGAVAYRLFSYVSAYAGWDWHSFSADESFAGSDVDVSETGFAYGLRLERPYAGERESGLAYRLRAGATLNRIEVKDAAGVLIADSERGAGLETGFAITFPLGESWRISPEIRYRALSRDLTIDSVTTEVKLRYMALDLGFTWSF